MTKNRFDRFNLFEELAAKHAPQVYNTACWMTGNYHDAQDLAQETLIRALKGFNRYNPELPFDRWIYRIMYNLYIDLLRSQKKKKTEPLDENYNYNEEVHAKVARGNAAEIPRPDKILENEELKLQIQQAIDSLSPEFRMVIILCDIEGLAYEEISRIMDCSIGTIRSRIHRSRKMLRKKLANLAASEFKSDDQNDFSF